MAAIHGVAGKSKPLKPAEPMTLKARRAQVATLRTPKKAGVMVTLPGGRTLVRKGSAKSSTKGGLSSKAKGTAGRKAAVAAIAAPSNLRIAPHDWFGFSVEWGDVKWDNPVGSQSYHTALYRASDNKLIKQWCDSYTADQTQWAPTFTRGIDDPTILTLGVGYYLKVSVSADPGTNSDPNGTGCATGWSAEAKSPTIVAQGPSQRLRR
ncbi:hypothetical protein ABT072_47025 [Streptomyces sp. NPDC002589]|uniref:hypothetical protein n=1 Tax=Streptomyces sp. NPDC002589 TaxID=3154420 RepID=UPI00332990C5